MYWNAVARTKKELMLLAGIIFIMLLGEILLFNREAIKDRFFKLRELHYTVQDGTLYQMELKNGKLVARGPNPNITFNNIDMIVDKISITCKNSIVHETGQVFFRADNEEFTWEKSISYASSPNSNTQIIDLPDIQMVTSLRVDLTHSEKDVIKCKEFVINPLVPFYVRPRRIAVYMVFVLLAVFEIVRKLSSREENTEAPFLSLSFQRLAIPLLTVCLVFPDVVFMGASLRITDQVHANYYRFPPILFYPHFAHHRWDAGMSDYGAAYYESEPMMEFMVRSLREGESPYWNPYSSAGSLGPETLVDNKFSAFTLAYAILGGGQKTYNFVLLSLYFMAAYFTFRLVREKLNLSFLASLTGTFFFLLNGYATANVGSNVTQSYLFVPMCLYASVSFIEKPTAWRISGVVLSFAAFFSCTFIPTIFTGLVGIYAVLLGYMFMLYRKSQMSIGGLLRVLTFHTTCLFVSLLLLAFIYSPIIENLRSTSTLSAYSERRFHALSWIMIPSVFSPSHFFESYMAMEQGVRDYAAQRDNAVMVYHFGATTLTLAICSISFKRRDFLPFVCACIVVILVGFGRIFGIPGISSLISKMPVISIMVASQYWWPLIAIPLIFLVALGVDNLQNRLAIPGLPFILFALLLGSLIAVGVVYGLREPNMRYKEWSVGLLLAVSMISTLGSAVSAYISLHRLRIITITALVLLAFAELTMHAKAMRSVAYDLFTHPPDEITFIKENIGLYRTMTIGYDFGVRHELGSAFGIQEATAINQGTLPGYMDYFHNMISLDEGQRLFYSYYPSLRSMQDTPDINTINWTLVDLLGIKYIIAPTSFTNYRQVFIDHGLTSVLDAGTVYVYENPNVLPRGFTIGMDLVGESQAITLPPDVSSKLKPATISLYRNNEILLKGTVDKPSLLVLTDNWHEDWTGFVNGVQSPILLINGTFRGVQLPAGPYEVRMYYQPRTLKAAFLTSGIIILLLGYILLDHKRIDGFLTIHFAHSQV